MGVQAKECRSMSNEVNLVISTIQCAGEESENATSYKRFDNILISFQFLQYCQILSTVCPMDVKYMYEIHFVDKKNAKILNVCSTFEFFNFRYIQAGHPIHSR